MPTPLVDLIRSKLNSNARRAAEAYDALLLAYLNEQEVDPDEAVRVLEAAGRNTEDLEAAAAELRERREYIRQAAELEGIDQQARTLRARQDALAKKRDDFCQRTNAQIGELEEEKLRLDGQRNTAEHAARWLQEHLPTHLSQRMAQILADRREVCRQLQYVEEQYLDEIRCTDARHLRKCEDLLRDQPDCDDFPNFRKHNPESSAKLCRADVELLRDQLSKRVIPWREKQAALKARLAELNATQDRILAQCLKDDGLA